MRRSVQIRNLNTDLEIKRLMDALRDIYNDLDIIENRTDDPSGEELVTGRIWFRTDLA